MSRTDNDASGAQHDASGAETDDGRRLAGPGAASVTASRGMVGPPDTPVSVEQLDEAIAAEAATQ